MPSQAQIDANRQNARLSTGPKTPEGKAAAAHNRIRFGLFCRRDSVAAELKPRYNELRDGLLGELAPETLMEEAHAMEIVSALWRLELIALAEAEALPSPVDAEAHKFERARTTASRALDRAMKHLRQAQSNRIAKVITFGPDALAAGDDFGFADFRDIYTAAGARPAFLLKEARAESMGAVAKAEWIDPPDYAEKDSDAAAEDATRAVETESAETGLEPETSKISIRSQFPRPTSSNAPTPIGPRPPIPRQQPRSADPEPANNAIPEARQMLKKPC